MFKSMMGINHQSCLREYQSSKQFTELKKYEKFGKLW